MGSRASAAGARTRREYDSGGRCDGASLGRLLGRPRDGGVAHPRRRRRRRRQRLRGHASLARVRERERSDGGAAAGGRRRCEGDPDDRRNRPDGLCAHRERGRRRGAPESRRRSGLPGGVGEPDRADVGRRATSPGRRPAPARARRRPQRAVARQARGDQPPPAVGPPVRRAQPKPGERCRGDRHRRIHAVAVCGKGGRCRVGGSPAGGGGRRQRHGPGRRQRAGRGDAQRPPGARAVSAGAGCEPQCRHRRLYRIACRRAAGRPEGRRSASGPWRQPERPDHAGHTGRPQRAGAVSGRTPARRDPRSPWRRSSSRSRSCASCWTPAPTPRFP